MARLARLPATDRALDVHPDIRGPRLRTHFFAFLSYSHKDRELADWLLRELEKFRVPHSLAGKLTGHGVVPQRLTPIFRDQHELSAGGDLADEVKAALAASQFLVVLCSPTAAKSRSTNEEIERFKRTRPESCVIAAIAAGEPFATDLQGREDEECFPLALRYKYDGRGHRTSKRADPLAADFRVQGEGKRLAFLKLVAGMLGVGLDELVRRDQTRRQRHLAYAAAGSLAGMAVTSTLAVSAIEARNEARDQRREAEGLLAFMVGDLKDKLEPIGRLDALDGVASRVLAYFVKQNTGEISDAALSQRSKALSLMGEVAEARGDSQTALKLYREAMAGTAEAMRRRPADPEPIFEHAQNAFYVGEIAHDNGDLQAGENAFRDYQRLARRMIALQPDSMKYRMEQQYADFNLGVVLSDERRFGEAVSQFEEALSTMQAISTADPSNKDYRHNIAESLTWLADAERAVGRFDLAIAHRQRNVSVYRDLFARTGDVQYRQHLIPALRSLGNLYEDRGQDALAEAQYRTAVAQSEMLAAVEPHNALWLDYGIRARLDLVRILLATGRFAEASTQANAACRSLGTLLSRGAPQADWRKDAVSCNLSQAKLALASGARDQALGFAQRGVRGAQAIRSVDKVADSFRVAKAYLILGDIERERGDLAAAKAAWSNSFAAVPKGASEMPDEIAERAAILQRLGRNQEAQRLAVRLNSIGYRATPFTLPAKLPDRVPANPRI